MKGIITIFLFALLTGSFLGDAGLWPIDYEVDIELSDDKDAEKEVQDKHPKKKFVRLNFFEMYPTQIKNKPLGSTLELRLLHISYEVDERPPRV